MIRKGGRGSYRAGASYADVAQCARGLLAALLLSVGCVAEDATNETTAVSTVEETLARLEEARAAARQLSQPELVEWAMILPSREQGLDVRTAQTMRTVALEKLMEGDGCSLPEWETLVSDALQTRSLSKIHSLAGRGRVYPENATESARNRVDRFLSLMEEEIQKPDNRESLPALAVEAVGRIVNRDWNYENGLRQKDEYWIEPPYGSEHAVDILLRCLRHDTHQVRQAAVRWLGQVGSNNPETSAVVVDELQAALQREETATDYLTGYRDDETRSRVLNDIQRAADRVSRLSEEAIRHKAIDAYVLPPDVVQRSDGTFLLGRQIFFRKESVKLYLERKARERNGIPQSDGTFLAEDHLFANEEAAKLFLEAEAIKNSGGTWDVPRAIELYTQAIEAQPESPFNAPLAKEIAQCYAYYRFEPIGFAPDPKKALYWWQRCAEYANPNELLWARAQIGKANALSWLDDGDALLRAYQAAAEWNPDPLEFRSGRPRPEGARAETDLVYLQEKRDNLVVVAVEGLADYPVPAAVTALMEIAGKRAGTPAGLRATELLEKIRKETQPAVGGSE